MTRRRSPNERLLEEGARVAPEPETAEERWSRLTREPVVVGVLAVATVIFAKVVAKSAGVEFFRHPGWIAAAVFAAASAVGIALLVRRSRAVSGDEADD